MKKYLVVLTATMALVLSTAIPASALGADPHGIIVAKTGQDAAQVTRTQSVGGLSISVGRHAGKDLTSYAQTTTGSGTAGAGVRMMSTLTDSSQGSVNYSLGVPAGADVAPMADGSVLITREVAGPGGGSVILGSVGAPWAVDANGRSLATSYTYANGVLTQSVDTAGAAFPVVTDPWVWVSAGYYLVPVFYLHWSWGATNYLNGNIVWIGIAMSYLCTFTGPAAAACALMAALEAYDIQQNVAYAVAHHRCLAQRIPIGYLLAYDGYTTPCYG